MLLISQVLAWAPFLRCLCVYITRTQEGYTKQRVPQGTWEMLLQMYNDALEERKSTPEPKPAQILRIENDRVPLPTVVLRHRNANPMPVSTVMGPFLKQNTTEWQTMVDEIIPRMEAWTGRWVDGVEDSVIVLSDFVAHASRFELLTYILPLAAPTGRASRPWN